MTSTAQDPSSSKIDIWQGDAFDLSEKLPVESIDLVLTSPPYWGLRTYGMDHNENIISEWKKENSDSGQSPSYQWYRDHGGLLGMEPIPEWFISNLVEIFEKIKPALKSGGSMWVNLGDTYFARWSSIRMDGRQGMGGNPRLRRKTPMGGYRQEKQMLLIPARFAIAMQENKWILRNDVIWSKPNVPPRPEKDRLRLSHEHFFHFVKKPTEGRAKYYYNSSAVEEGARDVVTMNVKSGSDGHSATFPEELIRPRISSSCPPGGTVLDPFCGTGRTLFVSQQTGRKGIGFEITEHFTKAVKDKVALSERAPYLF
ncbi:DNA-methyltransferase [Nocardiopsis alba]|uniref:DNA-methyltransferase n=1 Tax=Nocardiopsis alba TaxID=53437 RepID=UPI003661C489